MVDIQSATLRLGEEKRQKERQKPQDKNIMPLLHRAAITRKKPQGKNITVCPIPYGDHT